MHLGLIQFTKGFEPALPANEIIDQAILPLARGHCDWALETNLRDIIDDALECLFAAKTRIDDRNPVDRYHLDALCRKCHDYAAFLNGARSASAQKPSSDSWRKASRESTRRSEET